MSRGKFIGVIGSGNLEVEVDKELSGNYTFSAVGMEAMPLAVELARLQAVGFRDPYYPAWVDLLRKLTVMEKGVSSS